MPLQPEQKQVCGTAATPAVVGVSPAAIGNGVKVGLHTVPGPVPSPVGDSTCRGTVAGLDAVADRGIVPVSTPSPTPAPASARDAVAGRSIVAGPIPPATFTIGGHVLSLCDDNHRGLHRPRPWPRTPWEGWRLPRRQRHLPQKGETFRGSSTWCRCHRRRVSRRHRSCGNSKRLVRSSRRLCSYHRRHSTSCSRCVPPPPLLLQKHYRHGSRRRSRNGLRRSSSRRCPRHRRRSNNRRPWSRGSSTRCHSHHHRYTSSSRVSCGSRSCGNSRRRGHLCRFSSSRLPPMAARRRCPSLPPLETPLLPRQ